MQAPGRGSVKGAVLEPPSRSITRPQAMVFAGIGKNQRARCKMNHFATSPSLMGLRVQLHQAIKRDIIVNQEQACSLQ